MDINQSAYVHSNEGMSESDTIANNPCDRMSVSEKALLNTLIGMNLLSATCIASGIGMDVKFAARIHPSSGFVVNCFA